MPISRDLRRHWVYSDSQYLHIWLEILFSARYATEPQKDIYKGVRYEIKRGEFLFSRPTYADRLKISESKVRKCIEDLIKDGMIEKSHSLGKNKPTIFKVVNYEIYNQVTQPSEHVEGKGLQGNSTKWTPSGEQLETKSRPLKKKGNTVKNIFSAKMVDNIWELYPKKKGVVRAKQKIAVLINRFGEDQLIRCIERYKSSKESWRQWQDGSTFFNSGYVDFLDSNYANEQEESKYPDATHYFDNELKGVK
jgi:DNA-binding Lrp family transcriptional regulator